MAKFRNRPTIIEAVQWFPGKHVEGVIVGEKEWVLAGHNVTESIEIEKPPFIKTLEGNMWVSPGDWIVTGTHGERWPVKAHIFKFKYEPVDEEAANLYREAYGGTE